MSPDVVIPGRGLQPAGPESIIANAVPAMSKKSAGILMYKGSADDLHFLLVHPGGPFWAKKDLGAWSIPKGEYLEAEDALAEAIREFQEEIGFVPVGEFLALGELAQPSRKIVKAWAVEGDFDPGALKSNQFEIEWPPRSGRKKSFPEVDRAEWFAPVQARTKILKGQSGFIDRAIAAIGSPARSSLPG